MREFTIQLRTSFDSKEKEEVILTACRMAAKHVFAQATLIADKRKPQIRLMSGDLFESESEISLADDIVQDEPFGTEEQDDGAAGVP